MTKIIVFDFDNTLSKFSVPNAMRSLKLTSVKQLSNVFSEVVLSSQFQSYIYRKKLQGVKIVIASFGIKQYIVQLLQLYNLQGLIDSVWTPNDFGLQEGYDYKEQLEGKNVMLQKIAELYNVDSKNDVILIDDNKYNVSVAKRVGYKTHCVVEARGVSYKDFIKIVQIIES